MAFQQQELKPDKPSEQGKMNMRILRRRMNIVILILLFSIVILLVIILNTQKIISSFWLEIIAIVCFILSLPLLYLQGFFSHSLSKPEVSASLSLTSQEKKIGVHSLQMNSMQTTLVKKNTFRRIRGVPPPTNPKVVQQRDKVVKDVYAKLTQSQTSALILTGIAGCGKSTLAALLYQFVEEQRHFRSELELSPNEVIWLTVDTDTTMLDLAGTIFEALGKPFTDFNRLTPKEQASALFKTLNETNKARLVILDQFDNLLDWQTGHVFANQSAVSEWLDILNGQPSRSKILITSRPKPLVNHKSLLANIHEYSVMGLEEAEGIELLRKQGVEASEKELQEIVNSCKGHVLALTLLISVLRRFSSFNLKDFSYVLLWKGSIARNLLDDIYKKQLNIVQRKLLLAFSVYREPVHLDAAQNLIDFNFELSMTKIQSTLQALLIQHLIQTSSNEHTPDEKLYQPHNIVASYVRDHFVDDNEIANQQALRSAHVRAAQYYLNQADRSCLPRDQRRQVSDVHPLIEAVWHWCQAEEWEKAYELMEQEGLFVDLKIWGGNTTLLELCQLLLPTDKPHLNRSQTAKLYINLGEVYRVLGQMEQSKNYLEDALQIFKEEGDHSGKGWTLHNLGRLYADLGDEKQAKRYLTQALNIHKKSGDRLAEGWTLHNLGRLYVELGQKEEAEKCFKQALLIRKEVGDRRGEGRTLHNIGMLYFEKGRYDLALACFLLAKDMLEEVKSPDHGQPELSIKELAKKVGTKQFATYVAQVEPKASKIVEQIFLEKDNISTPLYSTA